MKTVAANFLKDESGATAIEYAMIALLVGMGLIGSLTTLKNALNASYTAVVPSLN